jgi:hypothetical protein
MLILSASTLHSCNQSSHTNDIEKQRTSAKSFDTLLSLFPDRSLPIVIHPCPNSKDYLNYTQFRSIDSAIGVPFGIEAGYLAYGKIITNKNYTILVTLGMADCLGVSLSIYDTSGKKIDGKYIGTGHCGSGPGFSCTETVKILTGNIIYTADSITEQETDSTNMPIPGGNIYTYVIYKNGKVLPDGHIDLSKEKYDTLKVGRDTAQSSIK